MHHERARHDVDRLPGRAHLAAALEAEIDLGGVGMAVIGADLARLPAGDGDVALADLAENLLDVVLGIPGLLRKQTEGLHSVTSHSRHLIEQPMLAICCSGPRPVAATRFIAW